MTQLSCSVGGSRMDRVVATCLYHDADHVQRSRHARGQDGIIEGVRWVRRICTQHSSGRRMKALASVCDNSSKSHGCKTLDARP